MALSPNAHKVYQHLIKNVASSGKVTTYAAVSHATGIQIDGGALGSVLGEIARACLAVDLPPLTAVIVQGDQRYDPAGRHGIPEIGYFVLRAQTDPDFAALGESPAPPDFQPDADRWKLKKTFEAHQNAVWRRRTWPERL